MRKETKQIIGICLMATCVLIGDAYGGQTETDMRMGYSVSMTVPENWQITRDEWYFFTFGLRDSHEVFGLLNAYEGEPRSAREVAEWNRKHYQEEGGNVSEVTDTRLGNQSAASIVVTENGDYGLETTLYVYAVKGSHTFELSIQVPADRYATYTSDMNYIVQNTRF